MYLKITIQGREAVWGSVTPELYPGFPGLSFVYHTIEAIYFYRKFLQNVTAMSSTHLTCRRRSVSAGIFSLLVFCAAAKGHHRLVSPVNGCYRVYPEPVL